MAVIQRNYHIGDRPVVSTAFADIAGTPTAPSAVTVKVAEPDGTITTYTSPHATISLGTTTTFTFPAAFDAVGRWHVQVLGTAGIIAGDEEYLVVQPSAFD